MRIYRTLLNAIETKGAAYLVLIDPDNLRLEHMPDFLQACGQAGVDGFLLGGSLLFLRDIDSYTQSVKALTDLPIIIFPGAVSQISPFADAVLFISLISGRNPEHLIGQHVIAAPAIKKMGIEPISTGYMLIESGTRTTAEFMSGSAPIPAQKPGIAVATALAAQYMGMKMCYLEAGSGAERHVPFEMVSAVAKNIDIPLIVGGGIRTPETAGKMVEMGAQIVVTGNYFEDPGTWNELAAFSKAIHTKL